MTIREFYAAVAAANINDEMTAYATNSIEKLDSTNAKRRAAVSAKAAEKAAEKEPLRAALVAVITDEPHTASELVEMANIDVKPASVPSLLKAAVEAGTITKVDIKVKGKGTARGYVRA